MSSLGNYSLSLRDGHSRQKEDHDRKCKKSPDQDHSASLPSHSMWCNNLGSGLNEDNNRKNDSNSYTYNMLLGSYKAKVFDYKF